MAGPEHKIQVGIVKWLRTVMPDAMVHHSANEVKRRGKGAMLEVSSKKNAGMMPGFPDLIVLRKSGSFFLEVKAGSSTSTAQVQVHIMLRDRGYPVAVVRSVDDVRDFLLAEGIEFREVHYG